MAASDLKHVTIYTDGACIGNPGPGGYGVVLKYDAKRRELAAGFRRTTNNRMEIMAAIAGLRELRYPCSVILYSDSQYLVRAMSEGWAQRWRARNWKKTGGGRALNADLWTQLLDLCERHQVAFQWIRGHAGDEENERCDRLSVAAAGATDQNVDGGYERQATLRGAEGGLI